MQVDNTKLLEALKKSHPKDAAKVSQREEKKQVEISMKGNEK